MRVDYKLIGARIKEQRKKYGITQEVLAEMLEVSIGYVSQVERGLTKISLDLLSEISTVLNCDVASLISESAINNDNYIETELVNEIKQLDSKKRKMVLDFIGLIKTW
ncbi:MAG: helix-turn-helix transcriptional regulator [Clostridia bacterium]|nr:helix-turn-helix transcriptional regulator [Clostridia bacterium]